MYPENPKGTQVIVGSMNMGYIYDTARNRTHNLFRLKRESIPLGHSDKFILSCMDLFLYTLQSIIYENYTNLSGRMYSDNCARVRWETEKGH